MKKNLSSLIVIGILIVAVLFIIFAKNRVKKRTGPKEIVSKELQDTKIIIEPTHDTTRISEPMKNNEPETMILLAEEKQTSEKLDKDVLAMVNHTKITEDYLKKRYEALSEEYKNAFKNDKESFLNQLIKRELLYQDGEKTVGEEELKNIKDAEERKDVVIERLIKDITKLINIKEDEMKDFYNEHKSEMKGASYEEVKSVIENYLTEQMSNQIITGYVESLERKAHIVKNEEWIEKQEALKSQNPLDAALKSEKPTVLDLGAGTCIPCKMMKPIFAELEQEYKGKANIILLEISEYRDLANRYQVMVIPTQIFFDSDGNQYWQHEGFLAKDEIIKKLKELGVE